MCGRYASARKREDLLEEFRIDRDRVSAGLEPDYNVAPTKPVYAVLTRSQREPGEGGAPEAGAGADDVARELRVLRWGLVPFWAKDPSIGSRMINARVETVDSKPAFRRAFAKRRCLLPADGYYEWKDKKPFYIHRTDGGDLALAGIYELWRDATVPEDHEQAWLWTAAVITTQAADEVGEIHDRMPMIIVPELWADWLDPDNTEVSQLQAAMSPAMSGEITSYPVSTDVNYVRNNGPELIRPLPTGG